MATTSKKKVTKKAAAPKEKKAAVIKSPTKRSGRFLGWQNTPVTQAAFGASTQGGSQNLRFKVLHSTGSVQAVEPQWYIIDGASAPIGRIATTVSTILMGKFRTTFSRGMGSGDAVIVTNADKFYFTSNKAEKKVYYHHTMFMGGLKSIRADKLLQKDPVKVLWMAVQGMMPKNKLSRYQLSLLKVYKGSEHPHQAQKPFLVNVGKALKGLPLPVSTSKKAS